MQRSALCRSRRELPNEYLLAKLRFDTAENEPCKVCATYARCPGPFDHAFKVLKEHIFYGQMAALMGPGSVLLMWEATPSGGMARTSVGMSVWFSIQQ